MKEITEDSIAILAPNASAVSNARKISEKGGFVKRYGSKDDTFYMGECSGSGKTNYITSVDFIEEENPVLRCSCPSRQFPCKHGLALLFEISKKKSFESCEIPEDILKKRQKKQARTAKTDTEKKQTKKVNKSARTKKIKKQLEGLAMTEDMIQNLLQAGLGTMGGTSIKTYRDLAKQLGNYYLSGPQIYVNRLILEIEQFQKDQDQSHYHKAIQVLVQLQALVKKARHYLNEKLEKDDVGEDDNYLYEELGGVWKLDQLQALGLCKEQAKLLQLSFQVIYDEARAEFIDTGWWADIETGELSVTRNYRPKKALKYIKNDDTIFDLATIPMLTYYPGEFNRRIRWEGATYTPVTKEQLAMLRSHAADNLNTVVKTVKNQLKNTLSEPFIVLLFAFGQIGTIDENYVMSDSAGNTILLQDVPGMEGTVERLPLLADTSLLNGQVLLGAFFYEEAARRICMQPYSILTSEQVVRLLY